MAMGMRRPNVGNLNSDAAEDWIKTRLLLAFTLLGPILLFGLFHFRSFMGLIDGDSMDLAQIARNLLNGRGWTTYIVRPLCMIDGMPPDRQPDLTHGPLYPLILAIFFAPLGATDRTVSLVGGLFYWLTVPMIYLLVRRFSSPTAARVAAWAFAVNTVALNLASQGSVSSPLGFLVVTTMVLLSRLSDEQTEDRFTQRKLPMGLIFGIGAMSGLIYLTEIRSIFLVPVILGATAVTIRRSWLPVLGIGLAGFLLIATPWMIHLARHTGNPFLGARGLEIWMNTEKLPGFNAYRMFPGTIVADFDLTKDVIKKLTGTVGSYIDLFPQAGVSWIFTFFVAGLFFPYKHPHATRLRYATVCLWLAGMVSGLASSVSREIMAAMSPVMIAFASIHLVDLLLDIRMPPLRMLGFGVLATVILSWSTVREIVFPNYLGNRQTEGPIATRLQTEVDPGDVVLSDQPWLMAWYGNRPTYWLPSPDERLSDLMKKVRKIRWVHLTVSAQGEAYGTSWAYLYGTFSNWKMIYNQQRARKANLPRTLEIQPPGSAIFEALRGFVSVPPYEGLEGSGVVMRLPQTAVGGAGAGRSGGAAARPAPAR